MPYLDLEVGSVLASGKKLLGHLGQRHLKANESEGIKKKVRKKKKKGKIKNDK